MKIALVADVHGNLPALEAILVHARERGVEEFWNLGDMVGYGPFPDECVKLLRKECRQNISGNYDKKALSRKRIEKMREKGKDSDKVFSFEWTNRHLSEETLEFIRSLPPVQRVDVSGRRVLIVHGSPEGQEDGLTPQTPVTRLEELAVLTDAELVVCGHTHLAFDRTAGNVRFVNPGGAGRAFDGDPRAAYAIIDIASDGVTVEHFRLDYDIESVARQMKVFDFPERLVRSLCEGRSLDELDDAAPVVAAEEIMARAMALGVRLKFERDHSLQVTALALKLFDGLNDIHGLTGRERLYLQCGGILHDVGFSSDPAKHHKASRDIILEAEELPLSRRERVIVALLARYHRGGMPEKTHRYYEDLSSRDRNIVDTLAGILRVADGLDRGHRSIVKDVLVETTDEAVTVKYEAAARAEEEERYALLKGDLLQKVLKRVLAFQKR